MVTQAVLNLHPDPFPQSWNSVQTTRGSGQRHRVRARGESKLSGFVGGRTKNPFGHIGLGGHHIDTLEVTLTIAPDLCSRNWRSTAWVIAMTPKVLVSKTSRIVSIGVDGHDEITLEAGDFVLLPRTPGFTISGFEPMKPERIDPTVTAAPSDEVRHGTPDGPPDLRLLGGYFVFGSPDAQLLRSLLPGLVHVRDTERLSMLVRLVGDETSERRPGHNLVVTRLVEMLLIEALRAAPGDDAPPGLLRGLADARLAPAIRAMHADLEHPWTVAELAREAALSRSSFFDRFTRLVGLPPMEYLFAWRITVAKDLLRNGGSSIAEIADRVGYGSASTFSTAFSRRVGQSPSRYARQLQADPAGDAIRSEGLLS